MIYTDLPEIDPTLRADDLSAGFGDAFGAAAKISLYNSPVWQINRTIEDFTASGKLLDYETARTRAKEAGADIQIDPKGMKEDALNYLIERKRLLAKANSVLSRGPQGFLPSTAYFVGGFGAAMLDPLNVASAFIPVARFAGMADEIARAGIMGAEGAAATAGARFMARARVGAAEGMAGQAMVEPLTAYRASQEQEDYGITDTLMNVGFGAVLGAVAHTGLGALGDRYSANLRAEQGKRLIEDAKKPNVSRGTEPSVDYNIPAVFRNDSAAAKLQSADMETNANVFRAEIAAAADGRVMDTSVLVPEKENQIAGYTAEQRKLFGDEILMKVDQVQQMMERYTELTGNKINISREELLAKIEEKGLQSADRTIETLKQQAIMSAWTAMNRADRQATIESAGIGQLKVKRQTQGDAIDQPWSAIDENQRNKITQFIIGQERKQQSIDSSKVQQAAKDSMLPENDVHFDMQAKESVDSDIKAKGEADEEQQVLRSLQEAETQLDVVSKQLGIDPSKNAEMTAAEDTVKLASKYSRAVEALATCKART